LANKNDIRQNSTARVGDKLFLSKPLGIGILSTAAKKNVLEQEDYLNSVSWMTKINSAGYELGKMTSVHAMTDVTGFGLLGHLLEMCEGSKVSAEISFDAVPLLDNLNTYISKNCIPGGTYRNWKSYGSRIDEITELQKFILADPQTSGGLLVAADPLDKEFKSFADSHGFREIGSITKGQGEKLIKVI
ncbi:MAG TPA: selenide, water dikinase SelD, partial [Bacteroidales bacterium]|jgi:selenide,water dikinase|nr:selenide, water dikinase SelD [Bacteroidales bacterium]